MTFEQQNIGGKPFAKPELRELPDADQLKPQKIPELIDLSPICEKKSPEMSKKDENVRKTSKAPKKTAAKVHSKPYKPAVARVQKKV